MSKNIRLEFVVVYLRYEYLQKNLGRIKIKYAHHQLCHMQFGLEILVRMLVAVYKRVEGLRTIFINLVFLDMEKMKSDVI